MNPDPPGVAVVSGAGSGIGREVALALARRGHRLALIGRRRAPLDEVLALAGGAGEAFDLDVRDQEALDSAAAAITRNLGAVDVVVPAAGLSRIGRFAEQSPADFDEVISVNLGGAAQLMRCFVGGMVARRRGALIPVLSVAARQGFPGWSAYCASKWGLLGLVETLRAELAGSGVRVVAVSPGATETAIWDNLPGSWDRTRMLAAADVARAVIWSLDVGGRMAVEEIRMRPPGGDL